MSASKTTDSADFRFFDHTGSGRLQMVAAGWDEEDDFESWS